MRQCLIVDGSPEERRNAADILAGLGFAAREAADAEVAIARCREQMPDLILLEIRAAVDAVTFLRRLRRLRGGTRARVLMVTGGDDAAAIGAAIWHGAEEYLVKPLDPEILAFKLQQIGTPAEHAA